MSDKGCQPTSTAVMRTCGTLGINQAFTGYHNPKGDANTERVIRTMKEECLWLMEWMCPFQLITALEAWIADYNAHYLPYSSGLPAAQAV
jgi:putative transposase